MPGDHDFKKKKKELKEKLAKIEDEIDRGDVDKDKDEHYKSIESNEYHNKHDADMVDYDKDILDKVQLKNQKKVKKADLSGIVKEQKKKKGKERLVHKASKGVDPYSSQDPKNSKVKKKYVKGKVSKQLTALRKKVNKIKNNPPQGPSGGTADTPEDIRKDAEAVAKTPSYIAKDHDHTITFKGYKGAQYKRASLISNTGKYAKYWLLNAKQTNGNGWGVSQQSIAKNIHKFVGKPLVVTAKSWIPDSEYGDAYEHPYLPTNDINKVFDHQEKFRVGSIVDIIEKDGDYYANIELNQKFAHMVMPPFCSPAIFQNNPSEPEGQIEDWEALHLAALHEDPAYGSRIALLRGTCVGTKDQCTVQFKAAKQEAKMVCTKGLKGRLATLKKNESLKQRIAGIQRTAFAFVPDDVINAFANKKSLRFGEKVKGRNRPYAFQTDGKRLIQSGSVIAEHTKNGMRASFQSHPSPTTKMALRKVGIDASSKGGKWFINNQEIDPNTDNYIEVPAKDIHKGGFKPTNKDRKIITKESEKRNKDQEYFRNKAEREVLNDPNRQDMVIGTRSHKKEVLDHGSISSREQEKLNKITGIKKKGRDIIATDYHHSFPAEKGGGIGGGIFNRRQTSGAIPLSKKTHMEAHNPASTIPKSFYSKLKQRLAVIRLARDDWDKKEDETEGEKSGVSPRKDTHTGKPGVSRKERLEKIKERETFMKENPNATPEMLDDNLIYTSNDIVRFDEQFGSGIPRPRVEGFSGHVPQKSLGRVNERGENYGKYRLTDEPVNVDYDILPHVQPGESDLSKKLEDERIDATLRKKRGKPETFGELFTRKYSHMKGVKKDFKNDPGEELKVGDYSQAVISKPNAIKYSNLKQRLATLNMPKGGITGMEKHKEMFNKHKPAIKKLGNETGYTIHDGELLDFNNQEHVNKFASAYPQRPGKKGEHLYMVANTKDIYNINDKMLGTMNKDLSNQGYTSVQGGWRGKNDKRHQIDLNAVFRSKNSKKALGLAKKYDQDAITEIDSVANTVRYPKNPFYSGRKQ